MAQRKNETKEEYLARLRIYFAARRALPEVIAKRESPEAKDKKREDDRKRRATPEGKAKRDDTQRKYRATPKGKARVTALHTKYRLTPKGRARQMLGGAKTRAKEEGETCNLTLEDVLWLLARENGRCFYFGTPLVHGKGKLTDDSPTLDRVDNDRLYERDNMVVCSYRANRCKSNLNEAQLQMIVDGMRRFREAK